VQEITAPQPVAELNRFVGIQTEHGQRSFNAGKTVKILPNRGGPPQMR
jgi:hypothetical protein